ncbi:MAG: dienelactone hydrolase family protein [Alphaproteobacteria bacterium]|nr:dienelactone hydrolase family protein [Alphaproteobacteria bacterium]
MVYEGIIAESVRVNGHENEVIDAYAARPLGPGPYSGVLVVHHMPGWDEWTREVVRKIADHGFNAISPDLHFRHGPGSAQEKSQRVRETGGQVDTVVLGDLAGGEAYLRDLPSSNGKVGLIGFCSGGRVAYMAATRMPTLDCAVDCWGGNVASPPATLNEHQPVAPIDMTADIAMPLLGLFGNADPNPTPEQVDQIEAALMDHGKSYEFYRYDGAGHAFFNWHNERYRVEQALDGWQKVFIFFEKHLGSS